MYANFVATLLTVPLPSYSYPSQINAKSKWTLQRVSLASLGPRLPNLQAATLLVHTVNGAVERQCLAALAGLPSLQCLVIDGTGAVGTNDSATSGFEAPTCLPSLAALGFDQPAEGLLLLAARLSHLTALGVSACGHVANLRLGHLSALTALQALKLQDCNGLTPARMAFLSCLTALRELELGKNSYEEPLELATLQGMTALQRAWAAERKAAAAA